MRHRKNSGLRRRYGRAGYLAKPLAFPDVKSFHELFPSWRPFVYAKDINARGVKAKHGGREANVIGNYVSIDGPKGHDSLHVTPAPWLIDYISSNMLALGDRITFKIIVRGKKEALVVANHSKIIGDRWLSMIDPKTIPEVPE